MLRGAKYGSLTQEEKDLLANEVPALEEEKPYGYEKPSNYEQELKQQQQQQEQQQYQNTKLLPPLHQYPNANELPHAPKMNSEKNYGRLPSETIKTGQGGVLDAAYTVGGRIPSRVNAEDDLRKKDVNQWAHGIRDEAAKALTDGSKYANDLQNENKQKKAEALQATELARQWKEYAEAVNAQSKSKVDEAERKRIIAEDVLQQKILTMQGLADGVKLDPETGLPFKDVDPTHLRKL